MGVGVGACIETVKLWLSASRMRRRKLRCSRSQCTHVLCVNVCVCNQSALLPVLFSAWGKNCAVDARLYAYVCANVYVYMCVYVHQTDRPPVYN